MIIMTKQSHDSTPRCGAKTRSGWSCKYPAGWGTDHLGSGRCKLHGGKSTGAPKKNKNSEKHGLFTKHLPEESLEIVEKIEKISTIDILWDNIKIQYAAILRAQKIMHVEGKGEIVKTIVKESEFGTETEVQYAWDRQDRFLNAQAKAMNNLTNMIMKYEDLCRTDLATEEQLLRIKKLKADLESGDPELSFDITFKYEDSPSQ